MKLPTTKYVMVQIAAIVASVEFFMMLLLQAVPDGMATFSEAILDTVMLALLSTPIIYIWVIKPFVIARDKTLAEISHLAHVDPLTQLANRRLLSRHLEKVVAGIVRHQVNAALLLIDLDGFKPVNDTHGHDAGDALLVEIAKRLQSITRSEDIVARMGGDEFVVLVSHLDVDERIAHDKASQIAEKLIGRVNKPVNYNGQTLQVGASIGIRLLNSEVLNVDKIISEADIALYRAKQAGKGCVVFFNK